MLSVIAPAVLLSAVLAAPGAAAPYVPGERMSFGVNYLGMRMGTAAITVREPEGGLLPLALEAHTTGMAGAVYDLQEKLVSHVEPSTGLPDLFVLDVDERGWKHLDTTRYDRAAGKAVLVQKGKTTSTKELTVPPGALDFVALVFQLRRLPLEPGDRRTFPVLSGDKVHEITAEVTRRERVRTRAGTFEALRIRVPTGFTGRFSEKNPTTLWLSDDDRRIVVKLTTDFSFGAADAELISYRPGEVAGTGSGD